MKKKERARRAIQASVFVAIGLGFLLATLFYYKNSAETWYSQKQLKKISGDNAAKRINNPWNRQIVDSCIPLLHSGDLVVRTGSDITSYMLCQMNQQDKTYSHCGIVMIENGYPFVYHSIGGEDNPDEVMRRDSVNFFFSPAHNLGFGIMRYYLDSTQVNNLSHIVRRIYKQHKKFDLEFDLKTDDRLYCAEFVYKAVNEATHDSNFLQPITAHGFTFIGIDNLFHNEHANVICQIKFK